MRDRDFAFIAGGACLDFYGVGLRRTKCADVGGEALVETTVRAAPILPSIGPDGRLRYTEANTPRYDFLDLGSGIRRPCLRCDGPVTNVALASEDLNNATYWDKVTLTITPAALVSGSLSLDLLSNAGTISSRVESHTALAAFTTATPVWFFHAARGNYAVSQAELFDVTSSTRRGKINITWNADGTIASTALTNAVLLETVALADGIYRFVLQCTGVDLTHTHRVRFFPVAETQPGTDVGTCYFGGVQVQDSLRPGAYAKTTAATVTTARDDIQLTSLPAQRGLTLTRDDWSIYVALARPTAILLGSASSGVIRLSTTAPNLRFWIDAGGQARVGLQNGTDDIQRAAAFQAGPLVDAVGQLRDLATTSPKVRINAGAGLSVDSVGTAASTDLNNSNVQLGGIGNGLELFGAMRLVAVARGLFDLTEFRSFFGSLS